MKRKRHPYGLRIAAVAVLAMLGGPTAHTQTTPGLPGAPSAPAPGLENVAAELETHPRLKFNNATLEIVMDDYAEKTGRTVLWGSGLPKIQINLRSQTELTMNEYLQAITTVLGMHGVALLHVKDKFVKVVPTKAARQEAMAIERVAEEGQFPETGAIISQLVTLKHIEIGDAKKAIEPLKHAYGQVNDLVGINSLLLTDAAENVNRMVEMLTIIDQPIEAREAYFPVDIIHAKASDIKKKLLEIIAESQKEQKKSTAPRLKDAGSPGVAKARPPTIPGVIRAPRAAAAPETPEQIAEIIEQAERGIIRGKVQIVADDRTNLLIIITRPENMEAFFRPIIKLLDIETAPDVEVKVVRLKYAEAKAVADMLNQLIGATAKKDEPKTAKRGENAEGDERSAPLREYVERRGEQSQAEPGKTKFGELSKDNIKILSDERTNSLIIMASRNDFVTLTVVIDQMDIELFQVLVEAVILEVNLDDSIETGVDWIQRSLISHDSGPAGRSPVVAWAGSGGAGDRAPRDATGFTTPGSFPADPVSGLTYYLTLFDLNVDMVVQAVANDSRTKVISSPIIHTTDNKEATIDVATERYFYKGRKYAGEAGGNPIYEDDVERKKVGISLKVTPRINEKRFVVMEVEQTVDNVSGVQTIGDTDWPIVTTRSITADVSVRSGDTIVLGGLVLNQETTKASKVPLLGDIPLLGLLFGSKRDEDTRNEVVVFITPYVLDSPEEVMKEARRRESALTGPGMWPTKWSSSRLGEDPKKAGRKGGKFEKEGVDPDMAEYIRSREKAWGEILDRLDKDAKDKPKSD